MINMMYLVLTALLAMNVSSQILEAFESLRKSLEKTEQKFEAKNDETREMIIAKVKEEMEQGNEKNKFIIGKTDEVYAKSDEIVEFMNKAIEELEVIAGKDPETGELHSMKEMELNYQFWMGAGKEQENEGRGAGAAIELRKKLTDYIDWANKFYMDLDTSGSHGGKGPFDYMAIDPKDDPGVRDDHSAKQHPWEVFTFQSKPVIADLAMLEKFKVDVRETEFELLGALKARLGQVTFKIDSLIGRDAPVSQVVAAGMKFETELFVTMSSSEIKPEFSGSGSIKVDPSGNTAIMTLNAVGGFAKGQTEKKQSYWAKIKVPKTDGTMAELEVKKDFTVRKPEVQITSAAVQNLYWKCGNPLNVDVPALGDLYNPVFKASSAQTIKDPKDKRKVTIVPSGKTCVLTVSSNTNGQVIKIDDVKYNVVKPPKPVIHLMVSGREYNGVKPIPKKATCTVKLEADSDFKKALPKDARYAITKVDLKVQRSLGAPTKVGSYNGSGKDATKGIKVSLGNKLKSDGAGTKIYFVIDKIVRINFKGAKVPEKFTERDLTIGAVIK